MNAADTADRKRPEWLGWSRPFWKRKSSPNIEPDDMEERLWVFSNNESSWDDLCSSSIMESNDEQFPTWTPLSGGETEIEVKGPRSAALIIGSEKLLQSKALGRHTWKSRKFDSSYRSRILTETDNVPNFTSPQCLLRFGLDWRYWAV